MCLQYVAQGQFLAKYWWFKFWVFILLYWLPYEGNKTRSGFTFFNVKEMDLYLSHGL